MNSHKENIHIIKMNRQKNLSIIMGKGLIEMNGKTMTEEIFVKNIPAVKGLSLFKNAYYE